MISKKMWTVFLLGTLMEGLICVKSEKVEIVVSKDFYCRVPCCIKSQNVDIIVIQDLAYNGRTFLC